MYSFSHSHRHIGTWYMLITWLLYAQMTPPLIYGLTLFYQISPDKLPIICVTQLDFYWLYRLFTPELRALTRHSNHRPHGQRKSLQRGVTEVTTTGQCQGGDQGYVRGKLDGDRTMSEDGSQRARRKVSLRLCTRGLSQCLTRAQQRLEVRAFFSEWRHQIPAWSMSSWSCL